MKRRRGLKLGRRLVRVWQWAVPRRTRRRPSRYLRLDTGVEPLAKSRLPKPPVRVVTDRLLHWGRRIALRLRRSGPRTVGDRKLRDEAPVPLLEDGAGARGCARPPKGHLAVYVGAEPEGGPSRRYLVPVIYFNHPLFGQLLREAEQEFGFHHPGGITIPCAAAEFERVRGRIAADDGEKLRRRCATSI